MPTNYDAADNQDAKQIDQLSDNNKRKLQQQQASQNSRYLPGLLSRGKKRCVILMTKGSK